MGSVVLLQQKGCWEQLVTGFSSLMLQVSLALEVDVIPMLEGAVECSKAGVSSSLLPYNSRVAAWVEKADLNGKHPLWPLLLDPQTSMLRGPCFLTSTKPLPKNASHVISSPLPSNSMLFHALPPSCSFLQEDLDKLCHV